MRTRLLCQDIPPAPADVDTDNPPAATQSACKSDRYSEHATNGSCKTCHELVDPIGFGLEQYDQFGSFRSVEADHPECAISGEGTIDGQAFQGPAGLADHVVDNNLLDTCMVSQLYRLAMGHAVGEDDIRYLEDLQDSFQAQDYRFDALVLALVGDEAFLYRREEN